MVWVGHLMVPYVVNGVVVGVLTSNGFKKYMEIMLGSKTGQQGYIWIAWAPHRMAQIYVNGAIVEVQTNNGRLNK